MEEHEADVLTIGHSTLSYEAFLELLRGAGVTAIADVRTAPFSRHTPQFNRETLRDELKIDGIAYVFLGIELGGRPTGSSFYCDGIADYERMAETPDFASGVDRVVAGSQKYRIALMCSEHDPLDCHRCLLVGRALKRRGLRVAHILSSGRQKSQTQIEAELLSLAGEDLGQADFLTSPEDRLAKAYRSRARKVAYSTSGANRPSPFAAE